jgi:hypothetical protein
MKISTPDREDIVKLRGVITILAEFFLFIPRCKVLSLDGLPRKYGII